MTGIENGTVNNFIQYHLFIRPPLYKDRFTLMSEFLLSSCFRVYPNRTVLLNQFDCDI